MASGVILTNQVPVYYMHSPDTSKTVYGLYSQVRTDYGTTAWVCIINVGQISGTSTLAGDLPARPCVLTIKQVSNSTSERAAITCEALYTDNVKHRQIWNGTIGDWY